MLKTLLKIAAILFLLLAILAAILYFYPHPENKIPPLKNLNELNSFVEQVVKENGLPSMEVAIIDSTGIQQLSVSGVRKKGGKTPVTEVDQYHLGSNTKAMTSVLTAMIIDEGLIDWETKIIEVFPELSNQIHTDYHDITIHQLLTHTSGIAANYSRGNQFLDLEIRERRLKIITNSLKDPTKNKKGEYLYSNLGYMIAGTILERTTNKSWETLMKEKLFLPLKMESAGFGVPGTIGQEDQPWGHIKFSGLFDYIGIQADNPEALGPAGTIHCSMEDWSKFIGFQLMSGDTSQLSPLQRTKLLTPNKNNYACGWAIVEPKWADELVYTHAGSNTFNFSQTWIIPKANLGILINTNSSSKNTRDLFRGVRNEILEAYKNQ